VSKDRTDEPAAVDNPPPQAEAFRDAMLLLIAVDAKSTQERLKELQAAESAVAKRERELARREIAATFSSCVSLLLNNGWSA
jgi:hypothetical protein